MSLGTDEGERRADAGRATGFQVGCESYWGRGRVSVPEEDVFVATLARLCAVTKRGRQGNRWCPWAVAAFVISVAYKREVEVS